MESKVLLYDAYGKKIGETFMRRARQLVKQQRAMWMDDRQRAVQFVADVDEWDIADGKDEGPIPVFDDEGWMVDLAKRRIRHRWMYVAHSVIFSLGISSLALALALTLEANSGNNGTLVAIIASKSVFFVAFIAHTIIFAINMQKVQPGGKGEGQTLAVEREVAQIKKQLNK